MVTARTSTAQVVMARTTFSRPAAIGSSSSGGFQALASWTASFDAFYDFENAAGSAAVDDAQNNDLTDVNSVSRGTTAPVPSGAQYADFVDAGPDSFLCTAATCPVFAYTTNYTICGWFFATEAENDTVVDRLTVVSGYRLRRVTAGNSTEFLVGDGTDLQTAVHAATVAWITSTWRHICFRFDDTTDLGQLTMNGEDSIVDVSQQDTADGAISITVGAQLGGVTEAFSGRMDALAFISQAMTLEEECRICSCNPAGALCMCDGMNPMNYKSCSTDTDCRQGGNVTALCSGGLCSGRNNAAQDPDCQNCTLPACNTASP
jgi:hypothetical protein